MSKYSLLWVSLILILLLCILSNVNSERNNKKDFKASVKIKKTQNRPIRSQETSKLINPLTASRERIDYSLRDISSSNKLTGSEGIIRASKVISSEERYKPIKKGEDIKLLESEIQNKLVESERKSIENLRKRKSPQKDQHRKILETETNRLNRSPNKITEIENKELEMKIKVEKKEDKTTSSHRLTFLHRFTPSEDLKSLFGAKGSHLMKRELTRKENLESINKFLNNLSKKLKIHPMAKKSLSNRKVQKKKLVRVKPTLVGKRRRREKSDSCKCGSKRLSKEDINEIVNMLLQKQEERFGKKEESRKIKKEISRSALQDLDVDTKLNEIVRDSEELNSFLSSLPPLRPAVNMNGIIPLPPYTQRNYLKEEPYFSYSNINMGDSCTISEGTTISNFGISDNTGVNISSTGENSSSRITTGVSSSTTSTTTTTTTTTTTMKPFTTKITTLSTIASIDKLVLNDEMIRSIRNEKIVDRETLQKIYADVEELREIRGLGAPLKNDFPCDVTGTWTSTIGGKVLNIKRGCSENNLIVQISDCIPKKDGFLSDTNWIVNGTRPFPKTGMIILTAFNDGAKQAATFVGECKNCDGKETVTGQWLVGKLARDCLDRSASQDVIGDVWKREMMHELRKKRLELP